MSDKIVAIDFETANSSLASVCAVGIATLEDGCIEEESYYSLIQPMENVSSFSPWNIKIHGIHPSEVEDAPNWTEVYPKMMECIGDGIVVAHNARFDMTCIKETCLNTGMPVPHFQYFDTVELSRNLFPQLPHHRLNDMCSYLEIELNHHHAGSDAFGCLMIVEKAMEITGIYELEPLLKATHTKLRSL